MRAPFCPTHELRLAGNQAKPEARTSCSEQRLKTAVFFEDAAGASCVQIGNCALLTFPAPLCAWELKAAKTVCPASASSQQQWAGLMALPGELNKR
jgi:hypothetical protein